jgi:flagellar hook-associated protein 3 FlgL
MTMTLGLRRVGDAASLAALKREIARSESRLFELQVQAASGRRIQQAADDPRAASRAVSARLGLAAREQWRKNVDEALTWLDATEVAVSTIAKLVADARVLAVEGASDTRDADSRRTLAEGIDALLEEMAAGSAAKSGPDHLFSGEALNTPPYEFMRSPEGRITGVTVAAGIDGQVERMVQEGMTVAVNIAAEDVFGVGGAGGQLDLFQLLTDLRDALLANDGPAVQALIPDLEAGEDQVLAELARIGTIHRRLKGLSERLEREAVEIEAQRSRAEDADMTQTFLDLGGEEAALRAALSTTSRVQQLSLFDYI